VTPAVPCPVSGGELAEFTGLIRRVGVNRAEACAYDLPDLNAVPPAGLLAERFATLADLQSSVRSLGPVVRDWSRVVTCGQNGLQTLAARCNAEREWVAKISGSWLGHVRDQAGDPLLEQDWAAFHAQLSQDRQQALGLRRTSLPTRSWCLRSRSLRSWMGCSTPGTGWRSPANWACSPGRPSARSRNARWTAASRAPPKTLICASGRWVWPACAAGC